MENYPTPKNNRRIGMHYLPDSNHFEPSDLELWAPALESIGAQWVTLEAPAARAIPEDFIRGLIEAGIEPILQFSLKPECPVCGDDLGGMLDAYANWGVHYISAFRAPNAKANWSPTAWTEKNLVGRFVERFLPISERIASSGLIPVFPALVPGGDYWDTAFLRTALEMIAESNSETAEKLALGIHAWAGGRALDWGTGGPERWPQAKPYLTPESSEDHLGIRIFDWYRAIAEAALGRIPGMMVLAGGSAPGKGAFDTTEAAGVSHADRNREIANLISCNTSSGSNLDAVPKELLNFNFWVLHEGDLEAERESAWFIQDGEPKAPARALAGWLDSKEKQVVHKEEDLGEIDLTRNKSDSRSSFEHYLLLPTYEWGVADWHLDVIRPFVKRHQPTVGYSIVEAGNAAKVTVVGGDNSFPEDVIAGLKAKGCEIERIAGDGTKIATQLMTL